MRRTFLLAVFTVLVVPAMADTYSDGVVTIDIPQDFIGPSSQSPAPGTLTVAYSKPYDDRDGGTLLQITRADLGDGLLEIPPDKLGDIATVYLSQFLGGVERRRTDFKVSAPETVTLDGLPAARATWSGARDGVETTGVMYCVVVGTVVVSLHTQDIVGAPQENRSDAMRAFEGIKFAGAD